MLNNSSIRYKNTCRHSRTVHSFDNDVVAVVADGGHRANAAHAEYRAKASVQLASERAERPHAALEAVDHKRRELSEHHAHVREGEIYDKRVGWRLQLFRFREQVKHKVVACNQVFNVKVERVDGTNGVKQLAE